MTDRPSPGLRAAAINARRYHDRALCLAVEDAPSFAAQMTAAGVLAYAVGVPYDFLALARALVNERRPLPDLSGFPAAMASAIRTEGADCARPILDRAMAELRAERARHVDAIDAAEATLADGLAFLLVASGFRRDSIDGDLVQQYRNSANPAHVAARHAMAGARIALAAIDAAPAPCAWAQTWAAR